MSQNIRSQSGSGHGEGNPAGDLADVWGMLDVLPTASATTDMAATTVDLMAVRLGPRRSPPDRRGWFPLPGWLGPIATVAGALLAGIVLGRVTAPDPVIENLPFIQHIDLLQEAGSRRFLEQLADLMTADRQVQPRWFRLARDPDAVRAEARQFDADVDALRQDFTAETVETRAARLAAFESDRLDQIEKSAETFFSLSPLDRREVEAVARALADPSDQRLRDAARLWHVIVAATPPPMRRGIVEMRLEDRLEWLQRPVGGEGRFDPRAAGRGRDDERRPGLRRGDGNAPPPGGPQDRDRQPPGWSNGPPRTPPGVGDGLPPRRLPPGPNGGRPGLREPGGISPSGLPPVGGPPAVPQETPAPPR